MLNQTIAAISTPLGTGGIGIIRISGPRAYAILTRLFVRKAQDGEENKGSSSKGPFSSHRLYYGHIVEPGTGIILDEVLVVYMKGPRSFTREDVVEIHSHSGFVVLDRILSVVLCAGAALPSPGEFTKRAFLNGRIDLTQAEAVIDLINAPCETAVHMASRQLSGGLCTVLERIVTDIKGLQATCEANIEFSDEIDPDSDLIMIRKAIDETILAPLSTLVQRQKDSAVFREGVLLAIAGAPNVGKSSLLNKLVDRETAIVSEVPGTTRDVVREYFSINGIPVTVCDTAGIHDTKDPVECLGIEKAHDHFQRADIILLVLEATRSLNHFEENLVQAFNNTKTIIVINKDDLADEAVVDDIKNQLSGFPSIRISAKVGTGTEVLKTMIFNNLVSANSSLDSQRVTPNLRQRKILENAKQAALRCRLAAESQQPLEIVSGMFNDVLLVLEDLTGNRSKEDLYDHIFSQFCIGK